MATITLAWEGWNATDNTTFSGCQVLTSDDPSWSTWTNAGDTTSNATCRIVWNQWSNEIGGWKVRVGANCDPETEQAAYEMRRPRSAADLADAPPTPVAHARSRHEQIRRSQRRAEKLLLAHLDGKQRADFRKRRLFRVVGSDGKLYEVDCGKLQHNVYELGGRNRDRVRELCLYHNVPLGDNALAQKLLLENDAERFRRVANHTELRRALA